MELRFSGLVTDGRGRFRRELLLPDASREHDGGWIDGLEQGTVNIEVRNLNQYASNQVAFGEAGLRELDLREAFPPQIYLPGSVIPNNTIQPTVESRSAGDLQFWRARISVLGKLRRRRCYMLRRVDSGSRNVIELVSDVRLRVACGLVNGDEVELRVYSKKETRRTNQEHPEGFAPDRQKLDDENRPALIPDVGSNID